MNKPYSGNGKPFVLALFCEKDRDKVLPVLEALEKKGLTLCGQDGRAAEGQAKRACTTVAFLSENFREERAKHKVFYTANAGGMPIIPVKLDNAKQPDELEQLIVAKNAIIAERYRPEELANRIASAESLNPPKLTEAQKSSRRLQLTVLLAAAVIALAVLGWLLWQRLKPPGTPGHPTPTITETESETLPDTSEPTPSPTPTPEPTPTPTPVIPPDVTEKYGISDENREKIVNITIIGNKLTFHTKDEERTSYEEEPDELVVRVYEGDDTRYYVKEDGSEPVRETYSDLDFLKDIPNLQYLNLACADFENMPDLSGIKLSCIHIMNCMIPDLDWVSSTTANTLYMDDVQDDLAFSPLTDSKTLRRMYVRFGRTVRTDLAGLAPRFLSNLRLSEGQNLNHVNLDSLSACGYLENVELYNIPINNLDFLEGKKSMQQLRVGGSDTLNDISAVSSLTGLTDFSIDNCRQIKDLSALEPCKRLGNIFFNSNGGNGLKDLSFLEGKNNIQCVELHNVQLDNLDFLKSVNTYGFSLSIEGTVRDWSAIAAIKRYDVLRIRSRDHNFSNIQPWLKDVTVSCLELGYFDNPDLSALPGITTALVLNQCNMKDLSGLPALNMLELDLDDLPDLESLNGIEALLGERVLSTLSITGCPRLTDWSALEGHKVNTLKLCGTYMMPDMEKLKFTTLCLEGLEWLENLNFLNSIPADRVYNFSLLGLDLVTDLSPLRRLKGGDLQVSPLLKEQAESLVEEGKFTHTDVVYPNAGWNVWNADVRLKSLEELDTLPRAALRRVRQVTIAGDQVVDTDLYEIWDRPEDNETVYVMHNRETDEEIIIQPGSMTDTGKLSQLTGLQELYLYAQQITDLEGIEEMKNLETLSLQQCPLLENISSVFTLEKVRKIEVRHVPIRSIQGIQNLTMLTDLCLSDTRVTDISPLAGCDLTEAYRKNGISLDIRGREQIADYTPLENIRKFDYLQLDESRIRDWLPHMQNAEVFRLSIEGIDRTDITDLTILGSVKASQLRIDGVEFLNSLHGIEDLIGSDTLQELEIKGCPRLTDWSALKSGYIPKLWLYGAYMIPDLGGTDLGTLRLERMSWVKNLDALASIDQEREINLELADLENLKDMSALKKIRGDRLAVTEDLLQQAQAIVRSGSFHNSEIADPEYQDMSNNQFVLLNLEETETLPESVLAQVTELYLAGDRVYNPNRCQIWDHWEDERWIMELHDSETGESMPVESGTMTDLSRLSGLIGLRRLEICCEPLISLAGIENMPDLEEVRIRNTPELTDVEAVWNLKNLQILELNQTGIESIDGIQKLKNLIQFEQYGKALTDISPLKKCSFDYAYRNGGVNSLHLTTAPETDLTPLEHIKQYNHLFLEWEQISQWLPYIRNATVQFLELRNNRDELQPALLPKVTERLELHRIDNLTDLTGLKGPGPRVLQLDNLPKLTSLKGLEGLIGKDGIREIRIGGCPRLTDWSVLEGSAIEKIVVYGNMVFLPDSLKDRAERTDGRDEQWDDNVSISFSSPEDLDSLPDEAIRHITDLCIIGDKLYDPNRYELTANWERNKSVPYVLDRETGEQTPVETSKEGLNLSFLEKMTGLQSLTLAAQPITDLELLRPLTGLTYLNVRFCTKLTDVSAAFDMPDLESLMLGHTAVKSLEGISKLKKLRALDMNGLAVTDLNELGQCDFTYAAENGGMDLKTDNRKIEDFSFLSAIPGIAWAEFADISPDKWLDAASQTKIHGIYCNGFNQEQLVRFLEEHPEISELHIPYCEKVTDLSMLPGMENLQYVKISQNMKKAVKSLEGLEYSFQLQID